MVMVEAHDLTEHDIKQAMDRAWGILVSGRAPTTAECTYLLQVLRVVNKRRIVAAGLVDALEDNAWKQAMLRAGGIK